MIDCSNVSVNHTSSGKFHITPHCALFDFSVYTVGIGTLVILGLVGNVISFIVLWADSSKTATVFLLRSMAVADSLVLIAAIPLYVLANVKPYTGFLGDYYEAYPNIVPYLWPSFLMPYTGTILLTVLVSLNRYCCVCRPFSSIKICSKENTYKHVIYVAIFSVAYNIPRFFEYHRIETCIGLNQSIGVFEISPFGENKAYRIIYANILYFVIMHGGPLLSLAVLNIQLIRALKKRQRKRQEMGKSDNRQGGKGSGYQQDVTLVLIVVICVFMCCQTPTFIDHLFWTFVDTSQRQCGNWHYYYTAVGDILCIFNSSINFFIYTLTSQKFRQNLTATCTSSPEFYRLPMTVINNDGVGVKVNKNANNIDKELPSSQDPGLQNASSLLTLQTDTQNNCCKTVTYTTTDNGQHLGLPTNTPLSGNSV